MIRWSLSFTLLLFVYILFPQVHSALTNNVWHIAITKKVFVPNATQDMLQVPYDINLRTRLWLGRLALLNHDPHRAQEWIAPLAEEGDPIALDILAFSLHMQGQNEPAFEIWKTLGNTYAIDEVAKTAKEQDQLELAIQAYKIAYELQPEKFTLALVAVLKLKEQYKDASIILQRSLDLYPTSIHRTTWLRWLGDIWLAQKHWDEAEKVYYQALDENPKDWSIWLGLGWVYLQGKKELDHSLTYFQKAIEIAPERGDGYYAIGIISFKEDNFLEASSWFSKAIERQPSNKWYLLYNANALRNAGLIDLALDQYQKTILQFPDFSEAYYELSWAHHLNYRPQAAIQAIEKAIQLNEIPNPEFYLRAATIYEENGEYDFAFAAYDSVLDIDPTNQEALRGTSRLK
jgi:tetratricopeptide (TPR) repeat protein